MIDKLIEPVTALCWQAADAIMHFYNDTAHEYKTDGTPLTKADIAAHQIIIKKLSELTPDIAIVSEESAEILSAEQLGRQFWLVDPLDGTKEFINKNGEFTVNIALIEDHKPILGFVCCPALDELFVGIVNESHCYKLNRAGHKILLKVDSTDLEEYVVVGSRSHNDPAAMTAFLKGKKIKAFIATGSSLKFCRIAEGKAHLYPRLGRTMEWDTAAGHAVLSAAGGEVNTLKGTALKYGKAGLDNPHFLASIKEAHMEKIC